MYVVENKIPPRIWIIRAFQELTGQRPPKKKQPLRLYLAPVMPLVTVANRPRFGSYFTVAFWAY
jgi:hypothetical protein